MLSMLRYDAAARQHVVLVECCWMSLFMKRCFQWFGLAAVVVVHWSCEFCFGQNKHFLHAQVPGVDIVMDYYYWMVQRPTDQCAHQKVQGIHSCMLLAFFFSVLSSCICCAWICRAPSLSLFISGVTWHALLALPHYRACLRFNLAKRKKMFGIKFPSLPSPCVELVCIYATYY